MDFFAFDHKLDPHYAPLRKYLEGMTNQDKEPTMFEDLNQAALGKLLDEQRTITEECRKRKIKAPQVCVILDNLADRGDILNKRQGGDQGSWLISLATRGRHFGVTWIISSQVINLVGTVLRKNVRCMCVWRLRNHKEVETLCEELSGVYDAKTVMEMYKYATADPFSFMFVRLDAKTRRDMFWLRFESKLLPIETDSDGDERTGPMGAGKRDLQQIREDGPPPGKPAKRSGKHQAYETKLATAIESGRVYGLRTQALAMMHKKELHSDMRYPPTQRMWRVQ